MQAKQLLLLAARLGACGKMAFTTRGLVSGHEFYSCRADFSLRETSQNQHLFLAAARDCSR